MMGDGMVSMGNMIVKPNATKIRRILAKGSDDPQKGTIVGFAGATADAFTLVERLEQKLDEYPGQLSRSCVELAKGWRTDKYLRRLEASLIVADENVSLEITGNGDVLEMSDGVISVGSGSPFALGKCIHWFTNQSVVPPYLEIWNELQSSESLFILSFEIAAARALMSVEDISAGEVASKAMNVAADMCVYTNKEFLSFEMEDTGNIVVDSDDDDE
jgi:ATP-dependent HslUV protease subunit HslV